MKLLRIINKKYAYFSVITLLVGMGLIYFFLQYFINQEIVEKLQNTKHDVIKSLDRGDMVNFYPLVEIKDLPENYPAGMSEAVTDTMIFNPDENEPDSYKQIRFTYSTNGRKYLIYVRTDNIETGDILIPIGFPALLLILAVLLISNIIINRINFKIWNPFYTNLDRLKKFSASDKEGLSLIQTDIDELRDLNNSLISLTNRIRTDYRQLKEFSENASHELQTPLSIIKVKIESLLQDEHLEKEKLAKLQSIYRMINRLSRLNQSLTLLSKLESIEYDKKENVCLDEFIAKKVLEFQEIADASAVTIKENHQSKKTLSINTDLLDILISNLLSNAVRYNMENGFIEIELGQNKLVIKNTGAPPPKDTDKMFERFEKGDPSGGSSGLGLTIAKQICSMNKFDISYVYEDALHIIQITFP